MIYVLCYEWSKEQHSLYTQTNQNTASLFTTFATLLPSFTGLTLVLNKDFHSFKFAKSLIHAGKILVPHLNQLHVGKIPVLCWESPFFYNAEICHKEPALAYRIHDAAPLRM